MHIKWGVVYSYIKHVLLHLFQQLFELKMIKSKSLHRNSVFSNFIVVAIYVEVLDLCAVQRAIVLYFAFVCLFWFNRSTLYFILRVRPNEMAIKKSSSSSLSL